MSNITLESTDLLLGALGEQLDARGERCERRDYGPGLGGFFWFYMLTSGAHRIPAVGQAYSPRWGTYNGRALARSGTSVQRGGLPRQGAKSVKSYTRSGGFGGSRGVSSS